MEIYNPKARLSAFIFINKKIYLGKTHTECLIKYLIDKKLIKNEKHFFKLISSNNRKNQEKIQIWSKEVEQFSIFGELSFYNKELSLFVFDDINKFGLDCLTSTIYNIYGIIPIYYAKYNKDVINHYEVIKLT